MTLIEKYPNAKPILFSTPMVEAILFKWKTQTRRVMNPQPPENTKHFERVNNYQFLKAYAAKNSRDIVLSVKKQPYIIGDILYVRETWLDDGTDHGNIHYKALATKADLDWIKFEGLKWKPSIFMPKIHARIFLRIKDVRVERIQDIEENEDDAIAEGVMYEDLDGDDIDDGKQTTAVEQYRSLWDSLNAKRGFSWKSDPWVWVYEFEVIKK
jgi:hypothetical protein